MEYSRNKVFKSLGEQVQVRQGPSGNCREARLTEQSPPFPPSSNKSGMRLTFHSGARAQTHHSPASQPHMQDKHKDAEQDIARLRPHTPTHTSTPDKHAAARGERGAKRWRRYETLSAAGAQAPMETRSWILTLKNAGFSKI